MPDHFAHHLRAVYWPKITAVCAVDLRPTYLKSLSAVQNLLHTFHQGAVYGMMKEDDIILIYSAGGKRETRGQHIITRSKFRMKASAADF